MEFVNSAMDDRNFDAAQIASSAHPLRLRFRDRYRRARLQSSGFHINPARHR